MVETNLRKEQEQEQEQVQVQETNQQQQQQQQQSVTVGVLPASTHVLRGITTTLDVLFNIQTNAKITKSKRPPIHLSLVLDKSGSMSGEKFENAKKAVKKVIENLNRNDKFHFVVYDTQVESVFENATTAMKDFIWNKLDTLSTGSCTNLAGGLEMGVNLITKYHTDGYNKRIFLFSDGLANEGITDKDKINQMTKAYHDKNQINIDSFGIGNDFDSQMMKNIAEYGGGSFYFISHSDEIPKLVSSALDGVLGLTGIDTILKIRGRNSAIVKRVYGHDNLVVGAKLGDLHQNNLRQVLAVLEISPKSSEKKSSDENEVVLSYELSYVPCLDDKISEDNKKEILTGELSLILTDDETKLAPSDKQVKAISSIQTAADMDQVIQDLVKAGDQQQALSKQKEQISLLESVVDSDTSGMSKGLLQIARSGLKKLESQGCSKEMDKHYDHCAYMKRRGSFEYMNNYL